MEQFSGRRMDGVVFTNCALERPRFDNGNLAGARLENVNLSGMTVENANVKGLRIFGYDVETWLREQLTKDGCHLD